MPVVALVMLAFPCEVVAALAVAARNAAMRAVATTPSNRRTWGRDVGVTAIDSVLGPGIPRPSIGRVGQNLDVFIKDVHAQMRGYA
jgi:hypothetical protein